MLVLSIPLISARHLKIDIFSLDVLIFPINQGNMHWTACAINFAKKRIEYYDSMGDYGNARKQVFRKVRGYVEAEHKEKKGRAMDWEGWHDYFNKVCIIKSCQSHAPSDSLFFFFCLFRTHHNKITAQTVAFFRAKH